MDYDVRWSVSSLPYVPSRLERIMGNNDICIIDKAYMKNLEARMREEHEEKIWKRIREREAIEVDREKKLILAGKMAIEDGPAELANHPGFKISQFTDKILEERRIKAEEQTTPNLNKLFNSSRVSLKSLTRESICHGQEVIILEENEIERIEHLKKVESDMIAGNLFTQEDYDRIIYESPLVKQLRNVENVEELYKLAEVVVGPIIYKKRVIKEKFILC